ncbi:MAG TPA: Na+/H+ antiporter NhaA [Pseudomonadales bacterium]
MTTGNNANPIRRFFAMESASGILMMAAAVLAMIFANSSLQPTYQLLIDIPFEVRMGEFAIAKPLLLWINDGLMAIFFFMIGLELKREVLEGELSDLRRIVFPLLGAIGGMAVPALIYLFFNHTEAQAMHGWAIPAATDIAFSLAILSLLGPRVPITLKIFLTSLAIFDDIGAIVIIALFYTAHISVKALVVVGLCLPALYLLNRFRVTDRSVYLAVGLVMWVAMLKSGVHATLAGVLLAMFIPMYSDDSHSYSPLKSTEHDLHAVVAYIILPVFAFANAGIHFAGIGAEQLLHPVTLGIALGLFVGKQIGVFSLCWLGVRLGFARLPQGMNLVSLYGVALLCGIGFTMSLFIGSLAFAANAPYDERLGIILGSLVSAVAGYLLLRFSLKPQQAA